MREEQILKARCKDLATKAYKQNIYTFTQFLSPAELNEIDQMREEIDFIDYSAFGGGMLCDRQVVRFGSERMFGYDQEWPIKILKVEPLIEKFADDLSHRDFLGAVMNLGIERDVLGDILVKDKKRAYIFCLDSIADYIMESLTKIKHTNVKISCITTEEGLEDLKPTLEDASFIVSAPRFDAIVAAIAKCSRSESALMFRSGKITLNGRLCENNSYVLKPGDIFSLRGYGKYRFVSVGNETRKGRIYIQVQIYR